MALGAGAAVALVLPFLCIWWELRSLRRQAELSELQSLRSYLQRVEDENEKAEDFLSHLWAQPAEPFPADKAVSNVTVITVDTSKPLESFNMLGASGVAVLNAAVGEDWHSWRDKTRLYYKFLKKFAVENPGRWVVLVDGFDTIFGGCSEEKLLEFFNRTVSAAGGEERSVVWGAENCCFPWRDSCSEYMHLTARRQAVLQEFGMKEAFEKLGDSRRCRDLDLPGYDSFCSSPPAYQHLNSGFLMGRAEHVLQSVSAWLKLYSNHSETDQLVARDLFLQHSNRPFLPFMTLDYSGALVLTVGNIPESAIPEVFSIRENGIYNLQTGLVQCFIHGAGPGKAFVAQLLRSQR